MVLLWVQDAPIQTNDKLGTSAHSSLPRSKKERYCKTRGEVYHRGAAAFFSQTLVKMCLRDSSGVPTCNTVFCEPSYRGNRAVNVDFGGVVHIDEGLVLPCVNGNPSVWVTETAVMLL